MRQSSATMERESAGERFEFAAVADALADRGFLLTNTEFDDRVGANRLAASYELRPRLLRRRNDADF